MTATIKSISAGAVVRMLFVLGIIYLLPLLVSWRWDWWEAWVYAAICIAGFAASRALAARRHPDILAERANYLRQADTAPWDKVLSPVIALGSGLILLAAGLDMRFGWSSGFGLGWELAALAAVLAGYILGAWALVENRYFSGTVRIQSERGHSVTTSGPYRLVRHPGYLGALITYLATPFFLDSAWALAPALLIAAALVLRTGLEDRFLHELLPGYREYAERVRYRLLPGIW